MNSRDQDRVSKVVILPIRLGPNSLAFAQEKAEKSIRRLLGKDWICVGSDRGFFLTPQSEVEHRVEFHFTKSE